MEGCELSRGSCLCGIVMQLITICPRMCVSLSLSLLNHLDLGQHTAHPLPSPSQSTSHLYLKLCFPIVVPLGLVVPHN